MKQFGLILFFANAFPLAPFFSFICNVFEIEIKRAVMFKYNRRIVAREAKSIGPWISIMEVLVLLCIPVSIGIIYFTGQNATVIEDQIDYTSSTQEFLKELNSTFWTDANIILLLVGVEHVLIFAKLVLAAIIPDVPSKVQQNESLRPVLMKQAEKEVQQSLETKRQKFKDKPLTFQDFKNKQSKQDDKLSFQEFAKACFEKSLQSLQDRREKLTYQEAKLGMNVVRVVKKWERVHEKVPQKPADQVAYTNSSGEINHEHFQPQKCLEDTCPESQYDSMSLLYVPHPNAHK